MTIPTNPKQRGLLTVAHYYGQPNLPCLHERLGLLQVHGCELTADLLLRLEEPDLAELFASGFSTQRRKLVSFCLQGQLRL